MGMCLIINVLLNTARKETLHVNFNYITISVSSSKLLKMAPLQGWACLQLRIYTAFDYVMYKSTQYSVFDCKLNMYYNINKCFRLDLN